MIYVLIIFIILFAAALAWAAILKSENHDLKDTAITLKVIKDGKWLGAEEWQREVTQEVEQWKEKYWDENRLHLDTKLELEGKWHTSLDDISKLEAARFAELERANLAEEQIIVLRQELSDLKASKTNQEQEEQGTFVKQRKLTAAKPSTYRNVFDLDINGQRVLEHLTQVFCRDAYADTERETCHRLGQQSVINFILNNVNRANNPDYEESDND
ncbi:Bbp19 family protein [Acinetobacter ursingii]|uniref:Bbp19 family protein n=1 Tax=Acinetobacter ursingii TaxID=108980 RepID=UPI00124FEBA0|nr:hypothetical protein [Acinetobacter ursingii]